MITNKINTKYSHRIHEYVQVHGFIPIFTNCKQDSSTYIVEFNSMKYKRIIVRDHII